MAKIEFHGREGYGYIGPFASRSEAEGLLSVMQAANAADECARIATYSSRVMTSDHSPIIVNVTAQQVSVLNARLSAQEARDEKARRLFQLAVGTPIIQRRG